MFSEKSGLLLRRRNSAPYIQEEEPVEKSMVFSFLIDMHMIGKMIAWRKLENVNKYKAAISKSIIAIKCYEYIIKSNDTKFFSYRH